MAYLVWSYSEKLGGANAIQLGEQLLPGNFTEYLQREANAAQEENNRPRVMPTGQTGHRLNDFQQGTGPVQAFSGEPFRLEPE